LKNGDLFQMEAIRVETSWYTGDMNPTKTDETRDVGVAAEIFARLTVWIANWPTGAVKDGCFRANGSSRLCCRTTSSAGSSIRAWSPSDSIGSTSRFRGDRTLLCMKTEAQAPRSFSWGAITATLFWVDPQTKLVAVLMAQTPRPMLNVIWRQTRTMVYQAMTN
jgi:hypothetical protein